MKIKLTDIRIDGGTQHRKPTSKVAEEYAQRMKDGEKFPPLEVYYDGKNFWLVDGNHRYLAYSKLGVEEADCKVTKGTHRQAVIASFAANKENLALPKTADDNRTIIIRMSQDETCREWTQKQIGDHIGVSHQYVARVLHEHEKEAAKQKTRQGISDNSTSRIISIDESTIEDGTDINCDRSETYTEKPESVKKDKVGKKLPKDLIIVFDRIPELQALIDELNAIHRAVKMQCEMNDLLYRHMKLNPFGTAIANAKRNLKFTKPYAVCPYCHNNKRDSCKACKGAGFINETMYLAVPEEMKE